jgi:sterol desaturase/sphingolipid hydroxylase (fatty acid hydroxylase superfamily)
MNVYHYIVAALFFVFVVAESFAKHRQFTDLRYWRAIGLVSVILYFTIATFAPLLWDEWLGGRQLFQADAVPFVGQIAIGFFVVEFAIYFWHRSMHDWDLLWRFTHQMHHSAERVDIWGAYYFHPIDMLGWAFLNSLCLVWIVGLTPEATLVVAILTTIPGMLQHTNVQTPHWLGYFVQRPESHLIHHQRGIHRYNYGDIPLPDILFGTFRNPRDWHGENGFHAGSTLQIPAMLFFRKIS